MNYDMKLNDIHVSYGENISNTVFKKVRLNEIFDAIRTDNDLKKLIENLRSIKDKKEFDSTKIKLPFFNLGCFRDDKREKAALLGAWFMVFDYDKLDDPESLKGELIKDDRLFALFVSPSGKGLKCIYRLDNPVTDPDLFSDIYEYYRIEFSERFNISPDTTSDASRICFFSYDPDLYLNPEATPLPTNVIPYKKEKSDIIEVEKIPEGNRNNILIKKIGEQIARGVSEEDTLLFALGWNSNLNNPLPDKEVRNTVKKGYKNYGDEAISGRCKEYFSVDNTVIKVAVIGDQLTTSKIGKEKYFIQLGVDKKKSKDRYYNYIVRNKHIQNISSINYIASIEIDKSYFQYNEKDGKMDVYIAPVNGHVQDNEFIEKYLSRVFGNYKTFIKEWLAVYFYTNYQRLPFLIIQGERGVGKNIFAESIMSVFPTLSRITKDLGGHFNPGAEKKLLIVDESDSQGKMQYTTLKKLSGQGMIEINEKFEKQYQVRNNLNIMILSNDDIPVTVDRHEMPVDECNNQFFVFKMKKTFIKYDTTIQKKIEERLLHYIRTELKEVFEGLNFDGYRYSIPTPITEEEKKLFELNATNLDYVVDGVIEKLLDEGCSVASNYTKWITEGIIPKKFFADYYKDVSRFEVTRELNKKGYLDGGGRKKMISGARHECYKLGEMFKKELEKRKAEPPISPFN